MARVMESGAGQRRSPDEKAAGGLSGARRVRRPRRKGARRGRAKPSLLRRLGRIIWVWPRHAALAFATGLSCGALASHGVSTIAPPYAAILGALVVYPAIVAIWRLVPRPR